MGTRFSVVLPTHNRADVLQLAIRSVLSQTEVDFELFVVGDGCTDNTAAVMSQVLSSDSRVRWLDLAKAPGFGYANRNVVFAELRSEFVAYMAHDDLWFPDHLQLLGRLLEGENAWFAYARPLWVDRRGNIMPSVTNLQEPEAYRAFVERGNSLPSCSVAHRTETFEQIGYWDDSLTGAADWDYWKRILIAKGPGSLRFEPRPSSLHFTADWRDSWPTLHHDLVREMAGHWPQPLKLDLSAGVTEQHAFAAAAEAGPQIFENIRTAAQVVLDAALRKAAEAYNIGRSPSQTT